MEITPASTSVDGQSDAAQPLLGDDFHHGHCANCHATLIGSHCHLCGQIGHIHRSLGAILQEFFYGVMHFEGRIWNSLPLLAWKPGALTRRYIDGERTRFISPFGLFLLAVFFTYAVFSLVGSAVHDGTQIISKAPAVSVSDGLQSVTSDEFRLGTGILALDHAVAQASKNPELLFYKMQANAYKFAWALVPISLPLMWLLFPFHRRFHLYDHFVFITYSISFALLLSIAARLVMLTPLGGWGIYATLLYFPVHLFRQLRETYHLSAAGAAWRSILLLFFCLIAAGGFVAVLVSMGVSSV